MISAALQANCYSCHQKPADNFHQTLTDQCSKCHDTQKWSPSTFDHSAYFTLDRDHNAKCIVCHTTNNYKEYTCYGCHEHSEGKIRGEHEEEGIYNFSNCSSCHRSGNKHDIRNGQGKHKEEKTKNDNASSPAQEPDGDD
jgi:hypothetical protein